MKSVVLEGPSRRLRAADAAFLYFERPHAPLTIGCLALLEGELGRADLHHHFATRLPEIRRYTERAVQPPLALAHPCWQEDPGFDLRNHVHRWALPSPGGESELNEVVESLMVRPLDRTRPLWEVHLIEGLHGGRSALLQKVHHCMIDGVGGAGILEALLDREPVPRPVRLVGAARIPREGGLGDVIGASTLPLRRSLSALGALRSPRRAVEQLAPLREIAGWTGRHLLDGPCALPWSGPIGPRRRMVFTRLSLEPARAVRAARGCTLNDVVLTVVAGGIRRYLDGLGVDLRGRRVNAVVPVNLRSVEQRYALGNRIGALLVPLALGANSETERLELTSAITRELKERRGFLGVAALLAAADLLPAPLVAWAGGRLSVPAVASLIATNVPGPPHPLYLSGHRVEALYPIVPISDHLGLGVAVLSYAGGLHVGLNADADLLPDLEKLRLGLEDAFACLCVPG